MSKDNLPVPLASAVVPAQGVLGPRLGEDPSKLTPAEVDAIGRLRRSNLSEGTQRVYTESWRSFLRWWIGRYASAGAEVARPVLPLASDMVAAFVTARATEGISVAQIKVDLAAIRAVHRAAGLTVDTAFAREVVSGYRRTPEAAAARRGPAPALRADHLRQIGAQGFPDAGAAAVRDRALIFIGWSGALRRSELAALRLRDVEFDPAGAPGSVLLTIERSKVDQEARGQTVVIRPSDDPTLCPVSALRAWLDVRRRLSPNVGPESWLWVTFTPRGGVRIADRDAKGGMSPDTFVAVLRARAERAGLDGSMFSGHSTRRGWITEAAVAGADARDIMAQSRHTDIRVMTAYVDEATKVQRVPKLL